MAWRTNTGAMTIRAPGQRSRFVRFGIVGQSDLMGVYRGRAVFVEVKRPGNRPTWAQEQFLEEACRHGAWAVWVISVDELIIRWGREFGSRTP